MQLFVLLLSWFTIVTAESNALFTKDPPSITVELSGDSFIPFHWTSASGFSSTTFHIDVVGEARLFLTDYLSSGDVFEFYDNDQFVGATSETDASHPVFKASPEEAAMDDAFSKGLFVLAEGSHEITIKASSLHDKGTGAIRLLGTDVPVDFHRYHHREEARVAEDYTDYLYYFNGAVWGPLTRADAATISNY
ncbi:hypothetical protein BD560DRAFT_426457 [Blakeslea trispora]|nr:hypothetical protein BD560DRAFT_426457 [Blakeslea trispora]